MVELTEVRKEIGNDQEFARWCIKDLGIGIGVITNAAMRAAVFAWA
jgi:hypothetical protein